MPAHRDVVRAIAKAFAAGPADPAATAERLKAVLALGGSTRWLAPFCARLAKAFPRGQPSDFAVRRFIAADDGIASAKEGCNIAENDEFGRVAEGRPACVYFGK